MLAELDGRRGLDPSYVVAVLGVYADVSVDDATLADLTAAATRLPGVERPAREVGLKERLKLELTARIDPATENAASERTEGYNFLLVLELGDRTLHDALTHERIAGHDFHLVRKMAIDLGRALHHLHQKGQIHADFKLLNAVRIGSTWQLIDLDICCKLGAPFGTKVPSSGYCPPEMARALLEATDSSVDERLRVVDATQLARGYSSASVAYDLWSFGAVLFHLVAGRPLWMPDKNDNVVPDDLANLAAWMSSDIGVHWQRVVRNPTRDQAFAFDLLRHLLEPDPRVRLQHFDAQGDGENAMLRVLDHAFFQGHSSLRQLKRAASNMLFECETLTDPEAYHLFLSHAWPAAQDRVRIIKERFAECLPSCRVFLDVDDLKSGSGTAEVDKSGCIAVFCTKSYFEKTNAMKELYRAVVQRRPILAILDPDPTQDGGLTKADICKLITNELLDKHGLREKWDEWRRERAILGEAWEWNRNGAPGAPQVLERLFAIAPVEWHRLPHLQDVTIRLIAQRGVARGPERVELYMEGEASRKQVTLPPPSNEHTHHVFCSLHNLGAVEVVAELNASGILGTQQVLCTSDFDQLKACDRMLLLLDDRTWTSGNDAFALGEHIEAAFRMGIHIWCVHEFPSLLGSPRHASEFKLIFDTSPSHLRGKDSSTTHLYSEIATALLSDEWRKPGLVALASKLAEAPPRREPQACEPKMVKWWDEQQAAVARATASAAARAGAQAGATMAGAAAQGPAGQGVQQGLEGLRQVKELLPLLSDECQMIEQILARLHL